MPYTATRRLYHMFGRKVSKYVLYKKAKKLCGEISRDMSVLEYRFLKSRLHHV